MGCFLACFGYNTKKRKRLKSCNKITSPYQIHGSYVPLESDVFTELDNSQKHKNLDSELRDKPKEHSSFKTKKKVSFNLNVKTYEPLQYDESDTYVPEGEEETKWEFNEEETQRETMVDIHHKADAMSGNVPYPASYRYQYCRQSYDEEDEITLEESDLDDDDFDDEGIDDIYSSDEDEDHNINQVKFPMLNTASAESDKTVITAQQAGQRTNKCVASSLSDEELNGTEFNHNNWHRNQCAYSVLNPVENLTQWKAIKARAKLQKAHKSIMLEQENQLPSHTKLSSYHVPLESKPNVSQSKPLMSETAVDASLSNWLL